MKITAVPRFELRFLLPLEAVDALLKLSPHHYDARCKQASSTTGFLSTWKRNIEAAKLYCYNEEITATFGDLDTSLKIMELAVPALSVITEAEYDTIRETRNLFLRLCNKLNELYTQSIVVFEDTDAKRA